MDINTISNIGKHIMDKLGLHFAMTLRQTKGEIKLLYNSGKHERISKWIFNKVPHLCTRLGRSKNHIARSVFISEFQPTQHKGSPMSPHQT